MRELELIKKFYRTYRQLGLRRAKIYIAVGMMFFASVLEMSGLSILYPLVLAMGDGTRSPLPFLEGRYSTDTQILFLFGAVALIYLAKNTALYFTYEYNINFAVYYYRHLVCALYNAHIHKPVLEFQKESAGSLSNILCVQPEKLVDGALRPFLVVVSELFLLMGISTLVFFLNPWLMLAVILSCGGTTALFYVLMRPKAHGWGDSHMIANSSQQELVSNTAMGINEIKVFAKENYLTSKLAEIVHTKTRLFHHLEMYQQGPRFILETMFIVTVMAFFSILLFNGTPATVLLAQFSVVAAASFRILPSISRIANSYSNFSYNIRPALTLLDTIETSSALEQKWEPQQDDFSPLPSIQTIRLDKVGFQYPFSSRAVLEDVSLEFSAGKRTGLIGSSGSGKSTLIKILAGLFTPTSGAMFIDGNEVSSRVRRWQACLGYVPQDSFIMPGSLRENIVFGNECLDDEKVWQALDSVGLGNFVRTLPEGLQTRVGEKGVRLSGGQKQIVCIARALFRNPTVLLLDEPTASLDEQNEKVVLDVIHRLPAETFIVMASHKHRNFAGFDSIYAFNSESRNFELVREGAEASAMRFHDAGASIPT